MASATLVVRLVDPSGYPRMLISDTGSSRSIYLRQKLAAISNRHVVVYGEGWFTGGLIHGPFGVCGTKTQSIAGQRNRLVCSGHD